MLEYIRKLETERDALQQQLDHFLSSTGIFERKVWSALGLEEQYDAFDGVSPDAGEEIRKLMALKQVIDRLTSDEAIEAGQEAYDKEAERCGSSMKSDGDCLWEAIAAALAVASANEGGER